MKTVKTGRLVRELLNRVWLCEIMFARKSRTGLSWEVQKCLDFINIEEKEWKVHKEAAESTILLNNEQYVLSHNTVNSDSDLIKTDARKGNRRRE